jgi:hypothetical protein
MSLNKSKIVSENYLDNLANKNQIDKEQKIQEAIGSIDSFKTIENLKTSIRESEMTNQNKQLGLLTAITNLFNLITGKNKGTDFKTTLAGVIVSVLLIIIGIAQFFGIHIPLPFSEQELTGAMSVIVGVFVSIWAYFTNKKDEVKKD